MLILLWIIEGLRSAIFEFVGKRLPTGLEDVRAHTTLLVTRITGIKTRIVERAAASRHSGAETDARFFEGVACRNYDIS